MSQPCENCDGNGGFKVDTAILYGIPGGEDWGEMCPNCKGSGIRTLVHVDYVCTCHRTACMFCDGGLWACSVCNSFEGATTTDCPGEQMTPEQSDAVYAGRLDYRAAEGGWVERPSPHTPNRPREAEPCTADTN